MTANATTEQYGDPTYGTDVAVPAEGLPGAPWPTPEEVDEGVAAWERDREATSGTVVRGKCEECGYRTCHLAPAFDPATADGVAAMWGEYVEESEAEGTPWDAGDFVTYVRHAYGVEL